MNLKQINDDWRRRIPSMAEIIKTLEVENYSEVLPDLDILASSGDRPGVNIYELSDGVVYVPWNQYSGCIVSPNLTKDSMVAITRRIFNVPSNIPDDHVLGLLDEASGGYEGEPENFWDTYDDKFDEAWDEIIDVIFADPSKNREFGVH